MGSIMDTLTGATDLKLNDKVIAKSTDLAIKGTANAYTAAALASVTPEVGRLCSDYLSQSLLANEAMTALILKKEWAEPYASSDEQLTKAYRDSNWVLDLERTNA